MKSRQTRKNGLGGLKLGARSKRSRSKRSRSKRSRSRSKRSRSRSKRSISRSGGTKRKRSSGKRSSGKRSSSSSGRSSRSRGSLMTISPSTSVAEPSVAEPSVAEPSVAEPSVAEAYPNPDSPKGIRNRPLAYRHTSRARFLSALCSDAGVCLAFGTLTDEIKRHFAGFTTFAYVVPPIKRIGAESANGFLNQIEYVNRGYKSHAILKSAKTADADNLLYEYVVGQYINKQNKLYPCFLETYGYYQYVDEHAWSELQKPQVSDIKLLTKGLVQQNSIDYNDACRESQKLAILIQYLKNIKSLYDLARDPLFIADDLMSALFQLYLPLARLKDNFTHYDLHLENVYLYQPVAGKYIQYHYYISSSRAVKFKSSYMLKIIDYGRSYFKDETGTNAKTIYDKELCEYGTECNYPETTGECGDKVGFSWLKKLGPQPIKQFYISSQKKNISHDLLPLNRIAQLDAINKRLTPELRELVNKVIYTSEFGTAELTKSGYPHAIYNVEDAFKCIMAELLTKKFQDHNEAANLDKTKLGDLYIYNDGRPMTFVEA